MNANEFVKKFGWFAAEWYLAGHIIVDNHLMVFTNVEDLKRLVESHELVAKFGGLFQAKITLDKESYSGGIECDGCIFSDHDLEKAIVDVESCK